MMLSLSKNQVILLLLALVAILVLVIFAVAHIDAWHAMTSLAIQYPRIQYPR